MTRVIREISTQCGEPIHDTTLPGEILNHLNVVTPKYNFIFYYKFYFLLDDQSYMGNIHSNVVAHDITFPEEITT